MVKKHLQCIEYDCRYNNSNTIQNNIIYIKATAKYRLQQFNSKSSYKSSKQSPFPCTILSEQWIEDSKGKKHHNIAQVLWTEIVEEIGNKIVLKSKPIVAPSAGRMVKEKIVDVPNDTVEKRQAQKSGDIAYEKWGQNDPSNGTLSALSDLVSYKDYPDNQGDRKCLQKETRICAEKEILKVHIARKVHEETSSQWGEI